MFVEVSMFVTRYNKEIKLNCSREVKTRMNVWMYVLADRTWNRFSYIDPGRRGTTKPWQMSGSGNGLGPYKSVYLSCAIDVSLMDFRRRSGVRSRRFRVSYASTRNDVILPVDRYAFHEQCRDRPRDDLFILQSDLFIFLWLKGTGSRFDRRTASSVRVHAIVISLEIRKCPKVENMVEWDYRGKTIETRVEQSTEWTRFITGTRNSRPSEYSAYTRKSVRGRKENNNKENHIVVKIVSLGIEKNERLLLYTAPKLHGAENITYLRAP